MKSEHHIRISEGQIDEVVSNPTGRPAEEVLASILHLVGLNDSSEPRTQASEVKHNARDQISGLCGLLRSKSLRRDGRLFGATVELLKETVERELNLREPAESKLPKWARSGEQSTAEEVVSDHSFSTYVIDSHGQCWKWECGWWLWDLKKHRPRSKRPLGHVEFSKIPKATRLELNVKTVKLGTRPYGEWRRWVADHTLGVPTLYFHPVYKHVKVLASDGVHAVVKNYYDPESASQEVMFNNLTELKMAETKHSTDKKEKKRRSKASTAADQVVVEITDDFLKSLLD